MAAAVCPVAARCRPGPEPRTRRLRTRHMPFVVTEPCVGCKHTDCVTVCPMDCFVEGPNFVVIDPEGCIDCSVCVPQCPVDAIVNAREIDPSQAGFVALNARLARAPGWRPITVRQPPMADHARWQGAPDKRHHLLEQWPAAAGEPRL